MAVSASLGSPRASNAFGSSSGSTGACARIVVQTDATSSNNRVLAFLFIVGTPHSSYVRRWAMRHLRLQRL